MKKRLPRKWKKWIKKENPWIKIFDEETFDAIFKAIEINRNSSKDK
jgi:hypothetical protein